MGESDWVYCDAFGTDVKTLECKNCQIKERKMVSNFEECPYYGRVLVRLAVNNSLDQI